MDKETQWFHTLDLWIGTWQKLATLSRYQEEAVMNWHRMLWAGLEPRSFLQLAPTWLRQTINPWSFSLFNVVSETKGDPVAEVEILTRVASYGSQLGTLIDALRVVAPIALQNQKLTEPQRAAIDKLEELGKKVDHLKAKR